MATWNQVLQGAIDRTNSGVLFWDKIVRPDNVAVYMCNYKGVTFLVTENRVKIKYKGNSITKAANLSELCSAIEASIAPQEESSVLDDLYTLLTT